MTAPARALLPSDIPTLGMAWQGDAAVIDVVACDCSATLGQLGNGLPAPRTGGGEEECLNCGDTPREIRPLPCPSGCCDLALCLPCAEALGYEID